MRFGSVQPHQLSLDKRRELVGRQKAAVDRLLALPIGFWSGNGWLFIQGHAQHPWTEHHSAINEAEVNRLELLVREGEERVS